MTKEKKIPSLSALARLSNPFDNREVLLKRILKEKTETRHLEWKLKLPFGKDVDKATKYRTVKATISFANTDGGFIVFGVDYTGNWQGITKSELEQVDPAKFTELINSCVTPDISNFNYSEIKYKRRYFSILHIPPSDLLPHVTTKPILVKYQNKKVNIILAKYAIYCRYYGKSDLATPSQLQKIIKKRTEYLKTELLRRVKEVPVAISYMGKSRTNKVRTSLTVTKLTKEPSAPAVRLTRNPAEATGVFLHEELSDGLFDEINNVLEANNLLAKGRKEFVLSSEIYYRLYAERQHMRTSIEQIEFLARTGLIKFYAPMLYWFLLLPSRSCASIIRELIEKPKSPNMYYLIRIAVLLGPKVTDWLKEKWEKKWHRHPQPPDYYWRFITMISRARVDDSRLLALRTTVRKEIEISDGQKPIAIGVLLKNPQLAASALSKNCVSVFEGDLAKKSLTRLLDIIAYGEEIEKRGDDIANELIR